MLALAEQVGSRAAFAVGTDPAQTVHAVWLPANMTEATAAIVYCIDRRRQVVDRRGPFSARLGTQGLRSGSHKLTLRFERKRGGAKKLVYRFGVC